MGWADFEFRSVWSVPAPADEVYLILRDVEHYPDWWPQVRRVVQLGETSGELHIRSKLPADLVFRVDRDIEDPDRRILRARLHGDLTGWSQWRVIAGPDRTAQAEFRERVRVSGPALRLGSILARPLLVANHAAMMRAGERGLVAAVNS